MVSTRWGIGLSPDSAVYVGAARNLLSGNGLSVPSYTGSFMPMMHYPPLVSSLLAGIGLFGIDPIDGARWLNATLFASNILLVGLCVYVSTHSIWLSVIGSFFTLISFPMVLVHSMAWSEPLFIFLGLLGTYLVALHIERPNWSILAASSVALALAFLTRYVGFSWIATGVVGLLLWASNGWKRIVDAAIFFAISCLPILLWIIRNFIISGSATDRKVLFRPLKPEHLESLLETVSAWILPTTVPLRTRWITLLVVLVFLALIGHMAVMRGEQIWRKSFQGTTRLPALFGLFILNYGWLLAFSILFLDAQTPFDNRILSPVYVATMIFFLFMVRLWLVTLSEVRTLSIAMIILFGLFSVSQFTASAAWLLHSYDQGIGYASRGWKQSKLLEHVKALDQQTPIFSNGPDIIYLLTGRPAYMIPRRIDPDTHLANSNYVNELVTLTRVLKEHSGVLVYFHRIPWRWYLPSEEELVEELGLRLLHRLAEGSAYQG